MQAGSLAVRQILPIRISAKGGRLKEGRRAMHNATKQTMRITRCGTPVESLLVGKSTTIDTLRGFREAWHAESGSRSCLRFVSASLGLLSVIMNRTLSRRSESSKRVSLMTNKPTLKTCLNVRMRRAEIEVPAIPISRNVRGIQPVSSRVSSFR